MILHAPVTPKLRAGLALGACTLALLASPRAHADLPTTYVPQNCRAAGYDQTADFDSPKTNQLHNKTTSTLTVFCPITKKTSGPNAGTNDAIKLVTVSVPSNNGYVQCSLETRSLPAARAFNVVGPGVSGGASTGTITINNTASNRPVAYWTANGANAGQPAWYFSYLACTLPPGTVLGTYTVTEAGTSTGYTIDPMLTCPLTSNMHWQFDNSETDPMNVQPSGYTRAQAAANLKQFSFACPVPGNSATQVTMAGAGGINPAGCNLNTSSVGSFAWPVTQMSSDWPSQVLPGAWQPVIAAPIVVGGANNTLYCAQNAENGDSKWFSYRTIPNASRVGKWTVTASVNAADANKAIDGDGSSRWSSNKAGTANMTYDVDLGPNWGEFNNITLDSGSDANDYARLFSLLLSDDGVNWFALGQYSATSRFTSFTFSEQSYRHIRIRLDQDIKVGTKTYYWSIHEIGVYFNDGE